MWNTGSCRNKLAQPQHAQTLCLSHKSRLCSWDDQTVLCYQLQCWVGSKGMQTALLSYVILSHPSMCKIKRKDQFHTDSELRHQKSVAGETCVCRQSRETFQSQVPHSLSSISDVLGTTVPDRVTGDYLHKQKLTSESCSVELMSTYPACEIQI